MSWTPQPTVTIGGVDFTSNTLNGISISYGRTNIWEQPRASYATVGILNLTNTDYGLEINDVLTITVKDSNANPVTVFTGSVTEISNVLQAAGGSTTVAVQSVTAVGSFAQMSRTIIGGSNWPKEYDDDRMNRIFTEANVTIDVVDTPGVYEFTSRDANPANAYTLATSYAAQAFGYIYETTDGKVGYANESRRTIDVENNGYLDIDEGYINWRGINSRRSISDIVNRIVLFYKSNAQVDSEDTHSITQYGLYEARVNTELENLDEAQNVADRYVSLRSIPGTNFSSFNINLENPNLLSADLDSLLSVSMGLAIQIDNLPTAISPVTYQGFVEGWNLLIDREQTLLTVTSSDSDYSIVPIRWQDIDPALEWLDLDPTAIKTTRTNLVTNPSLETAISGWNNSSANITISQTTADSYIGTGAMQIVTNVAGGGSYAITNRLTPSDRFPVVAGDTIYIQAYAKRAGLYRNSRLILNGHTTATASIITEQFVGSTVTLNSATWTLLQFSATFTNPAVLWAGVGIAAMNTGVAGDIIYVDAIIAEKNSGGFSPYYFDGSLSNIPASARPELAWTGTVDRSASTAEAYFGDIPTITWENVDTVGLP